MEPDRFPDDRAYIAKQLKLWFGRKLGPEDMDSDEWRKELPDLLKSHLFFQNLLKILGGRIRRYEDIFDDLQRVMPELREAPKDYCINVLNSALALVSSAMSESDGHTSPFLQVGYHLWLRELRRMVGEVKPVPNLRFADDLNDEQLRKHLPVVHCRECNSMGWAGLKRLHDNAVNTDLQSFYIGFFNHDPKVVFLFPEEPEALNIQADGMPYLLCSECIHVTANLNAKECPNCNHSEMIRVFMPDSRIQKKNRQEGDHDCPYCGARNGLTVLGSQAASLTSVMISQLYTSPFNDDKKLLAFSDSVQDAAHRAGFFQGRTYRFNFRSALQQFVSAEGNGLAMSELPNGFERFWLNNMDQNEFIATFLAPNMTWFSDYEALKKTGKLPEGSRLLDEIRKRIHWEIFSEYGYRCRVGRTLEKTGSSLAYPDQNLLDKVVEAALEILRNEIGGLEKLDRSVLRLFVLGVITRMKHQGAIWHDVLNGYIDSWGKTFLLNRIRWMPGFSMNSRSPAFPTTKNERNFDRLFGSGSGQKTWYETWAVKCFSPVFLMIDDLIRPIYDLTLKSLVDGGVLKEKIHRGERIWGILPEAMRISSDVCRFECRKCGHELSVSNDEKDYWTDGTCMRFQCNGLYQEIEKGADYYGKLYAGGDIQRIFAEEHTGLLERDNREKLEERFKSEEHKPWDPNLLSCTPTLEMGIDIGDLSTVILCSVPPAQANYLQRIGRAGRRDGNALNLTIANARPHDLYFFTEPESMIEGMVDPPGVFLNASAVLERQFTAFCLDKWTATGISPNAMPLLLRNVLGNVGIDDRNKFPNNLLYFIETHRTELIDRFITIFSKSLTEDSIHHLGHFVEGDREMLGSLTFRIIDGLFHLKKERESLKKKVKSLSHKIRTKKQNPVKDQNYQKELDELIREKNALNSLVTQINDRQTLNFFTDEGLIPNYAFPEAGVILRSIIYRRKEKLREGESRYETFTFDYERPAISAINELAPESKFYAGGRKVRVDQVDLSVSEIETWRLCDNCSHHALIGQTPETSACIKCGSTLWSDSGRKRQMIRLRQVFASTSDWDSRITDDSDDREPTFYNKQIMVGHNDTDITDAYVIENDELPFGFEFIRKVNLREINFGEKEEIGDKVTIAGVESPRKGFVICKYCGKIQDKRKNEIQHTLWCPSRNREAETNLTECIYLYREFSSEAIRMLLPVTTFNGSEKKLHSLIAALHLGLKKTFGGNIDHLQTAIHEEPIADSVYRKKFLVLYDTVPGGTGYLKQLMRSEKPLMQVFETALETLKACPCNQDPRKDGCYQCLFAYRRSYHMGGTSRETASGLFAEILNYKDHLKQTESLKNVRMNSLFDSELEARFIEALRRVRVDDVPAKLKKEVVNGKPGYFYRLGDYAYYIEPQASLGHADGVAIASKADFLIRPARKQNGFKPIAVFTDGFFYHKDRIGQDMAQRSAVVQSGKFNIWSLSWKDVENRYKPQGDYFHNHLKLSNADLNSKYNQLLGFYGIQKISDLNANTSFDWLIRFLCHPDESVWAHHALVHCLLHLDKNGFAADEAKQGWHEKLQSHLPDYVNEQVKQLPKPLCRGLYQSNIYPGFMKLFVAINPTDIQNYPVRKILAACCLMDDADTKASMDFEAAWNGYIRLYNLLQFLPNAYFATQESKALAPIHRASKDRMEKREAFHEKWNEIQELVEEELKGLIDQLAEKKLPVPEAGFELGNNHGEIIAESEFGWPDYQIALLTAGQLKHKNAFTNQGWHVWPIDEMLTIPESFINTFEQENKRI